MAMSWLRGAGAAALCALALVVALTACTNNGSPESAETPVGSASPGASPEGSASPGASPEDGASPVASPEGTPAAPPGTSGRSTIDGIAAYVTDTGLEGEPLDMADPVNCNAYVDPLVPAEVLEANEGKVCIDFFVGEFSVSEGFLQVLIVGDGRAWNLTMELADFAWHVTGQEEAEPRLQQPLE